jgi:ketosteroid isomerase-like protein
MNRRQAILASITGLAAVAAAGASAAEAQASPEANPELEQVRALLRAHDEAFTNHNLDGVMACLSEKAAIMGTGPGEIWSGPDEIKVAYQHFFEGFDQGQQRFEYQFRLGKLSSDMGWMMTAGNVTGKKDGKDIAFPLNLSLTVTKGGGNWKIAAMHFSTLTGDKGTE